MEKESSMLFKLKETIFSPLVLFGFLILAGFIFSGLMFKSGLSDISVLTNANGITVSGTAERFVKSDRGSLSLSLKTSSLSLSDAEAQKQLSVAREALVKYLVTKGIDEKEIDVLPYTSSLECSMRQSNNWENCLGKKYAEYSQILNLASNDVLKIKDFSLNINSNVNDTLKKEFATTELTIQNTQYFYTNISKIKSEMLNEATKNAFERAEAIAKSTGNNAGAVITASNKEFSRLPPRIALIVKIMDRMTLQPLRRKSLQLFVLALR